MTNEDVTRHIWWNTLSNYVFIVLRVGLGLVMFRMLYQGLSNEEFGFWALLWSVFGFGILLDFGFGFTAVKRVAELSVHQKWDDLSKVLSTIFYLYVFIGIAIMALLLPAAGFLIDLFGVTAANQGRFESILVVFVIGMALGFPLGIFPEILAGQQRLCLSNVLFSAGIVGNFACLAMALHFGWELKTLFIISLASAVVPCVLAAYYALRQLPHVRIHPKYFSFGMIRETLRFSVFAYVITVSSMVLMKTDQLVIGSALAVSAIAIYQAGAKIGEMFGLFAQQLPETFSPAAAHFNAKKDKAYLRQLLINGTRLSVMIATPAYLILAFYMEGVLLLITGDKALPPETFWIGQVLLLWGYMGLVTQSVAKRIFVMCGHERRLMRLSVGEAVLNLVLSVGLILYFRNVVCVAIGSLVATLIFGWFYMWPWAAREAEMSCWRLAQKVLLPVWLACLPLLGFIAVGRFLPWLDFRTHVLIFLTETGVASILGAWCLWQYALTAAERDLLAMKAGRLFSRARSIVA